MKTMMSASKAAAGSEATVRAAKLLRELVGYESTLDHAVLDEKNANGVVRLFADGGEQHGRACLQGHNISARCQKG
jgi:hypothetical protein